MTFAVAEKQIKLEDIERDNLLSERRVNRDEEAIKNDQSQHLGAPIHVRPQYQVMLRKCLSSFKNSETIEYTFERNSLGIIGECE